MLIASVGGAPANGGSPDALAPPPAAAAPAPSGPLPLPAALARLDDLHHRRDDRVAWTESRRTV